MNERIKELMKQSMVEYQFDLRFSPEKFAELIVQECASICYKSFENGDEIAGLLMQTFGVEE